MNKLSVCEKKREIEKEKIVNNNKNKEALNQEFFF